MTTRVQPRTRRLLAFLAGFFLLSAFVYSEIGERAGWMMGVGLIVGFIAGMVYLTDTEERRPIS